MRGDCKDCVGERSSKYYWEHKSVRDDYSREVYRADPEKRSVYNQQYYYSNQKERIEYSQQYYKDHLENRKEFDAEYWRKNKKRLGEQKRTRQQQRRQQDPLFKLIGDLRARVGSALKQKSFKKTSKFWQYTGCTLAELKVHIEQQFTKGMSWSNRGNGVKKWNIDHIVPLSLCEVYSLDGTRNDKLSLQRLYSLCHYTNLQPLWQRANVSKGNKLI